MSYKNPYPYIFVHGMLGWGEENKFYKFPYWGMIAGNQMKQLRAEGIEAYAPQVGPLGSAWDRACELYAQLTGTRVDYGAAHSKAKGHDRYGMTFTKPVVEGWGSDKKIHLIGHSFGGATIRMLAELLTNGSEAERQATPKEELSPLFEGGHGDWIKSITTVSAPHDGTTFTHTYPKLMVGLTYFLLAFAGLVGHTGTGHVYDFKLSQWGLTQVPDELRDHKKIFQPHVMRKIVKSKDYIFADLRIDNAMDLNRNIHTSKDIYYFSISGNGTQPAGNGTYKRAPIMFIALAPFARGMGKFPINQNINGAEITEEWRKNDGLVSLESGRYPHLEPHCMFEDVKDKKIEKGIWHVLPDATGDHGTVIGGSLSFIGPGKPDNYRNAYKYWIDFLEKLPD